MTNGEIRLQLPEPFWGQEVEIIVLAADSTVPRDDTRRASLRGALKQYARPERIASEEGAWSAVVRDEHESD